MNLDNVRVNGDITSSKVLLIDQHGEKRGEVNTNEAINLAKNSGLDLVEVSNKSDIPVCKIVDFGKMKYDLSKKASEQRKKQKANEAKVKELKMSPNIGDADYKRLISRGKDFISEGCKVLYKVKFSGREVTHSDAGLELLQGIKTALQETAEVEKDVALNNKDMTITFSPKK